MKLLKNKFSETAILLPLLAIVAFALYYFYISYTHYTTAKKTLTHIDYTIALDDVLDTLGEEQRIVAIYLGMEGKNDFKYLEKQWKHTDNVNHEFYRFLDNHTQYKTNNDEIRKALEMMKTERTPIKVLNTKYTELYFTHLDTKPIKLLLTRMHAFDNQLALKKESYALLETYVSLARLKENSYAEQGLLAYFLSRAKPISEKELELWDGLISDDILPIYTHFNDKNLIFTLDNILKNEAYVHIGKEIYKSRIDVIRHSTDGYFSIDLNQWYMMQHQKIIAIQKAQKHLIDRLKSDINQKIEDEKRVMFVAMAILLIFLLLMLFVRHIFSKMAKESEKLEDVLKNLNINSKVNNEHKLKKMIEEGDTTEIYQFLEKTILEAKESKRLAEQANRTKSLFLANMSHEIRTPLNGIVGFTDILKDSHLNAEQREFVEIIEKSSENLLSVINDILDLSKIESEKIEIENIEFDAIVEFESGIESYGAKAAEKNIDLGLYVDPDLSHIIKGDPNKIKQVLVNLISNAVKFTPEGGEINVIVKKVMRDDATVSVTFSVQDTGVGISQKQKAKIFEAFSQADSSTSRKFGGTGLGLTISKKLVEHMGGALDLVSEEGKGSTFFFTLVFEEVETLVEQLPIGHMNIAYYLPKGKQRTSDGYVEEYITALSGGCHIIYRKESFENLSEEEKPALVFVNYTYVQEDELAYLNALGLRVCLMTSVKYKDAIKALNLPFHTILYAPINYSKIKRSILKYIHPEEDVEKRVSKNIYKNIRALVAEDNSINQKLIKHTLENIGLEIILANNGKEALALRRKERFDIIFMDIQMPVMDGVEATHAIIAYEKTEGLDHVPIVALTANALKGDKERFLAEGMDEYISKPIKLNVIDDILQNYFKQSVVSDRIEEDELVKEKSADILLFKQKIDDVHIFRTLLNKIGYSVDVAEDMDAFKKMIRHNTYAYVLIDRELLVLAEDGSIGETIEKLSLKSILFVENLHFATHKDYQQFDSVVLNVPNMDFLRNVIFKLNQKRYDKLMLT